jgi:hypothetical protein
MRFENTDIDQNDWLISKSIDTEETENLQIKFSYSYHSPGTKPKLFYTATYNGDASQSVWTEVEYSLGENENEWYSTDEFIIETPGDTTWFAFQYQAAANEGIYFLLDNFSVKDYIPPPIYELVGSTEHFEFYTDNSENTYYWLEIKDRLEEKYSSYFSLWNIPGMPDFMDDTQKTKVYLTERENIIQVNESSPDWKKGFFDCENNSLYLESSILDPNAYSENFYKGLNGLALHTYAGYALQFRIKRDGTGWHDSFDYFEEAFGLYEQGFRPERDSIISFLNKKGRKLIQDDLVVLNLYNSAGKDIAISYVEGQILLRTGYRGCRPHNDYYTDTWNNYLTYFYDTTNVVQIKKYDESENFDIFCSSRDTMFIDSVKVWLEKTRQYYIDSYQMEINHRSHICILYDFQTTVDLTWYGGFAGGGGALNISPHNFYDGIGGYPYLLAHEFGHVFNDFMYYDFPTGFYHEGMANFSAYMQYGATWDNGIPRIERVLYFMHQKFGREPLLEEFINDPYRQEEGGDIDPYYFGLEFIRYLYENFGTLKIKEFFSKGLDFSVFDRSYQEIEKGYLIRVKRKAYIYPQENAFNELPFTEPFESFAKGWTKPSFINPDNWQINDGGTNGSNCARFYTVSDKNEPIESWLISPALNAENMNEVNLSFDFSRFGEGIELEVFYTDKFEGYTDSTNWTSLKSIEMPIDWGISNTGEITINNMPDTLFIGLRMKSTGEQHQQLYIDNFEVNGNVTDSKLIASNKNSIKIYPNPVTGESVISFQTKTSGKVDLSIFDMQGRKIATLLNEKLHVGRHTIPVSNLLPSSGIYFCKLQTSDGILTKKLIVNAK